MGDLWNNTCVVLTKNGDIILSDPLLRGHNEAINYCGKKLGFNIDVFQPMTNMVMPILENGNICLLNCGRMPDDNGVLKRTGYIGIPDKIDKTQIENMEKLILLLTEFKSINVWMYKDKKLKTIIRGNISDASVCLQELINQVDCIDEIYK